MRKNRLFGFVAALVLAVVLAAPAAADTARPFHGSWVSADGFDLAAPGCPAGAFLRYSTTGRDEFTHLGLVSVSLTHCTWLDGAALTASYDLGVITLTAANGDMLELAEHGTCTLVPNAGMPPFASAACSSTWSVTGGTGRFAQATGSGTGRTSDDMIAGIQRFELWGSIDY